MKKKLLTLALVGFGAWWLLRRKPRTMVAVEVKALPTDSMAPGSMPAAVTGRIKDRQRQASPQPPPMTISYY